MYEIYVCLFVFCFDYVAKLDNLPGNVFKVEPESTKLVSMNSYKNVKYFSYL